MAIERPEAQMGTMAPGTVCEGTCPAGANARGPFGHGARSASGSTSCSRPDAQRSA